MSFGEVWRRIAVLSALASFVVAYGPLPAFAEEAGARVRKAKPASGAQEAGAAEAKPVGGVAVPGTPAEPGGAAAGMAPPKGPPVPESQRSPDMFDRPGGEASAGRVEPPGPVPSGPGPKAGIIGDTGTEAMNVTVRDRGPTTPTGPPPKDEIRATGSLGTSGAPSLQGEAGSAGSASSPPIPESEGQRPPRPPGPVEAPPGN